MKTQKQMMNLDYVNPLYVEDGEEDLAAEFDAILAETLPDFAAEMSEGYVWNAPLPDPDDFQTEADELASLLNILD